MAAQHNVCCVFDRGMRSYRGDVFRHDLMCAHGDLLLRRQNSGVRTGLFDKGQCECRRFGVTVRNKSRREVIMSTQELSETRVGSSGPAAVPAGTSLAKSNR